MIDRELEAIRKRDADFKNMPDHYQGPRDRRYLLKLVDDLTLRIEAVRKEVEKYESDY